MYPVVYAKAEYQRGHANDGEGKPHAQGSHDPQRDAKCPDHGDKAQGNAERVWKHDKEKYGHRCERIEAKAHQVRHERGQDSLHRLSRPRNAHFGRQVFHGGEYLPIGLPQLLRVRDVVHIPDMGQESVIPIQVRHIP